MDAIRRGNRLRRTASRRGSILLFVIWTVILLSILVAGMGAQALMAFDITARVEHRLEGAYVARGGLQRAVTVLAADVTRSADGWGDEWANNRAMFADQPFGGGSFTIEGMAETASPAKLYGLIDEERRLNLNTAPKDVLRALLSRVGRVREDEARMIADAIEDWRDKDEESQPDGAENFYYLGLEDAYESKNGPFENVEELLLVRGVTPQLYARVAPALTVHGSGQVNINTAGSMVLQALGMSEKGITALLSDRAGPDQQPGTPDDRVMASASAIGAELAGVLSQADLRRLTQLAQQHLLTVQATEFEVNIAAKAPETETPVRVQCVVTRAGQIKAWAER